MAQTHLPPPRPLDPGPTTIDGDRRIARRARRMRDHLRTVAVRSVVRERRLGRLLVRELGSVAFVLHGRWTDAGERIDHLVVATSGVWVIEARHDRGRVEHRRRERRRGEAWLHRPTGDGVPLVHDGRTVEAVQVHLDRMGFGWIEARRVVCLTNAGWGLRRRSFELDGTLVTRGRALVDRIGVPGPLGPSDMRAIAIELGARLPTAPP